MIVKKLSVARGGAFPGAGYNERKVAEGVAKLMLMENVSEYLRQSVDTLHRFGLDAGAEIERYLKERSKTYGNTNTDRFQFHVSASVEDRTMSPEELTDFARKLMNGMGYEKQPYFVYAHHDTDNNHVHILSTRIQPSGFPISDHKDIRRLTACANRILSTDINTDIERMFSYDYETEGQFANIVRAHGFKMEKSLDGYRLFKNGGDAGNIEVGRIFNGITKNSSKRKDRATQLRAIIKKYKSEIAEGKSQSLNNPEVSKSKKKKPKRPSRNPDIKQILERNGKPLSKERQEQIQQLIDILKKDFGIDIFFQKDKNGQVRGYGLVDHSGRIAFDGSKIMELSELIDFAPKQKRQPSPLDVYRNLFTVEIGREGLKDYVTIHCKDSRSYRTTISAAQYLWYNNAKPEDKEDVSLLIASAMFRKEILSMYLNRDPNFKPEESIKSVHAYKQRNGIFAYSIKFNDGFTTLGIPMEQDENNHYRTLNPDDQDAFLMQLAVCYLTNKATQEIIDGMNKQVLKQTGLRIIPLRQKEYTPELTNVMSHILSATISRFNVGTGHGQNREWEVGKHNPYDDLDIRQSGTRLSM